ncbi:hypothetical protein TrispH2_002684 [Trichoplax sp. H2]|uniref:Mammalian ependymin-related protein 1 n=1 Tax=Trichoplax adhaerens TaxID=10228 RepID=B3RPE4_TRIAD|nr:expressed hypothetical protein [Trichoplax adhaerens]EDV27620.1 expressed hypothetical protein [Trichoplax adhaerens]RDD45430.1 hypothetical protein TrispH2_002684 [Trichoplax sp. H2]|eukprot:XP_002109454.1 expressed hypothetical protein [Trichoplax adhaerens]
MLRSLIFLAILCSAVYASKKPCCVPGQWSGMILQGGFDSMGKGKAQKNITFAAKLHVYLDAKMGKYRVDESITTSKSNITVISDYKAGLQYLVIGKKCTTSKLMGKFPNLCIPKTANFLGSGVLGLKLNYDLFSFSSTDRKTAGIVAVTDKGCLPVFESITLPVAGKTPQQVAVSQIFSNIKPGIKDDSIFKKPSNCPSQPEKVIQGLDPLTYLHERLVQRALKQLGQ